MHQNGVEKKEKGISAKTVRLSIEVPECIRDEFRDAVEKNGKCMKDVLRLYMQKYIWKQSELQRNREKRRQSIVKNKNGLALIKE
ncbi:hypothetical protein ACT8ZR_25165 [Neobacillus sp. M.A.Huq-85]